MPALTNEAAPYMEAFETLSAQRSRSEAGPNPISISDLYAFVRLAQMTDPDEIDDLTAAVVRLDNLYLKDAYAKINKARNKKPPARAPRGGG